MRLKAYLLVDILLIHLGPGWTQSQMRAFYPAQMLGQKPEALRSKGYQSDILSSNLEDFHDILLHILQTNPWYERTAIYAGVLE